MANPFEDFIQLELPNRPWMASDVQEESVIVRRGQGARQLQCLYAAAATDIQHLRRRGQQRLQSLQGLRRRGGTAGALTRQFFKYFKEVVHFHWVLLHACGHQSDLNGFFFTQTQPQQEGVMGLGGLALERLVPARQRRRIHTAGL